MSNSLNCQHIPTDLIIPSEAAKIAGGSTTLAHARRFNPAEFPKNYGGVRQHARYSLAEVIAFFEKYPASR